MQLNKVVLPAPFGPISAVISRGVLRKGKVADGNKAAKAHRQVLDGKDRRRRHAGVSVRALLTMAAGISLCVRSDTEGVRVETRPRGR